MSPRSPRRSTHFFTREADGSVRLRIRFDAARASLIEKAAGNTPLLEWIDRAIQQAAERDARKLDAELGNEVGPPTAEE